MHPHIDLTRNEAGMASEARVTTCRSRLPEIRSHDSACDPVLRKKAGSHEDRDGRAAGAVRDAGNYVKDLHYKRATRETEVCVDRKRAVSEAVESIHRASANKDHG